MNILFRYMLTAAAIIAVSISSIAQSRSYLLDVGDFSELHVRDGISVDYACSPDSAGKVTFECDPEIASSIVFSNKGGKLSIQLSDPQLLPAGAVKPTLRVYSRFLTKANNTSDSTLRILSMNELPKFEALQEGNGRLVLRSVNASEVKLTLRLGHGTLVASGKCSQAKIHFTGTGLIQADALDANEVSISCSGTGSIGVNPKEQMSVSGVGSTTVYYLGTPKIRDRAIGVKILPLAK